MSFANWAANWAQSLYDNENAQPKQNNAPFTSNQPPEHTGQAPAPFQTADWITNFTNQYGGAAQEALPTYNTQAQNAAPFVAPYSSVGSQIRQDELPPTPTQTTTSENKPAQPLDFARNMTEAATPIADKGILGALGDELGKALAGFGAKTTGQEVSAAVRDIPVLGGVVRGVETGLALLQAPSNVVAKPLSGLFELGLQKAFGDVTGAKAEDIDSQYQRFANAIWSNDPLRQIEKFGNAKFAYEEQRDPLTALSQAIFDPLNLIPANRLGEAQAIKRAVEATGDVTKLEEAPMLAKLWLTLSKPHIPTGDTLEGLAKLGAATESDSSKLRYVNPFTFLRGTPTAKAVNFSERVQDYMLPLATDRSVTRANLLDIFSKGSEAAKEQALTPALREVMANSKIKDSADFRRVVSTMLDYAPDVKNEQAYQQAAKLSEAVGQWTSTERPTRAALQDTLLLSEPFEALKAKLPAVYQGAFTRFEKTLAAYETGARGTNVMDIRAAAQQLSSDIEQIGKLQLAADYVDHSQRVLAEFSKFAAPNLIEKMVNKIRPYESTLFIASNPHSIAANFLGNWAQLAIHGVPAESIANINQMFGRAYNGGFDKALIEDVGSVVKQLAKDERLTVNAPYATSLPKAISDLPGIKQLGGMWQSAESNAKLRAFYKGWNNAYKSAMKYGDTIPAMPQALQDMIRAQMGDKGLRNVEKQIERALNTDEVRAAIKEGLPTWQAYREVLATSLQKAFDSAGVNFPMTPEALNYFISHGADEAINEALGNAVRRARNGEDIIQALTDEQQRLQMQSEKWQAEANAAHEQLFGKADTAPTIAADTANTGQVTPEQLTALVKSFPEKRMITRAGMYNYLGESNIPADAWDDAITKLLDDGLLETSKGGNYKLSEKGRAVYNKKVDRFAAIPSDQKPTTSGIIGGNEPPRNPTVDVTSGTPTAIADNAPAVERANKLSDAAKQPRHELPSQLSQNMADAAADFKRQLQEGEAGRNIANYDPTTGEWTYQTVGTSNPRWYADLVEKYKTNKPAVEAALNRIIEDNGKDTGLQVERVKEIILQQLADGLETSAGKMPPDFEARYLLGYPQDKIDEAFKAYQDSFGNDIPNITEKGVTPQNGEIAQGQGQQEKGLLDVPTTDQLPAPEIKRYQYENPALNSVDPRARDYLLNLKGENGSPVYTAEQLDTWKPQTLERVAIERGYASSTYNDALDLFSKKVKPGTDHEKHLINLLNAEITRKGYWDNAIADIKPFTNLSDVQKRSADAYTLLRGYNDYPTLQQGEFMARLRLKMIEDDIPEQLQGGIEQVYNALGESAAKARGITTDEFWTKYSGGIEGGPSTSELSGLKQEGANWYYSQLTREIEGLKQDKFTAEQLRGMLKGKVKDAELKWTGFDEWLTAHPKATKQEALDYLNANQVRVEEVVKGDNLRFVAKRYDDRWGVFDNEKGKFVESVSNERDAMARADYRNENFGRGTKYSIYTTPGGENYRELLLTMPTSDSRLIDERRALAAIDRERPLTAIEQARYDELRNLTERGKAQDYRSSHWDEPNILAHVRFNDRTTADGKRMLFVEEIQSDWAQAGRDKGFRVSGEFPKLPDGYVEKVDGGRYEIYNQWGILKAYGENKASAYDMLRRGDLNFADSRVPAMPFPDTYEELALKRMLRYASENGYDAIGWTTGAQQAERYNLRKRISAIIYKAYGGRLKVYDINGNKIIEAANVREDMLPEYIGKEATNSILNVTEDNDGYATLRGLDIPIGGEGMKAAYDKRIPNKMNALAKKFGGKVEEANIPKGTLRYILENQYGISSRGGNTLEEAQTALKAKEGYNEGWHIVDNTTAVHSINVTPDMRAQALQGFPLFQNVKGETTYLSDGRALLRFFTGEANASTYVHEAAHMFMPTLTDAQLETVAKWTGLQDGAQLRDLHARWTVRDTGLGQLPKGSRAPYQMRDMANATSDKERYVIAQEKFARGFEKYLAEGVAPNDTLRQVFESFKTFLTDLYHGIMGSEIDVKLSPEMRQLYKEMLGGADASTLENTRLENVVNQRMNSISKRANELDAMKQELKRRSLTVGEYPADVGKLNEVIKGNPDGLTWADYLKQQDLIAEENGVKMYRATNSHYIVKPDNTVETYYGFHGNAAFNRIVNETKTPTKSGEPFTLFQDAIKKAASPDALGDRNIHAQLDNALVDNVLEILKPYLQADFVQNGGTLSPDAEKMIEAYLKQVDPAMREARQAAQAVGRWYIGHTVLNYNNRWNVDDAMGLYGAFTFYPIHMAANMAQDWFDKPALLAQYMRLRQSYADYTDPSRNNVPERFKDRIKIPLPFLPEWMGDSTFINPFPTVYPADNLFGLDALQRASYTSLNGEPQDAASFISDLYGPHAPYKMAWQMLTGDKESFNDTMANLPPFRIARALTVPMGIGGAGGFAPFASKYDNYYIERALRDMLGNGEIDAKTFKATLLTRKGEVWDKAVNNAGLQNYTAPVLSGWSGFTGKVLPSGETKYLAARQQRDELQQQLLAQYGANPNLTPEQAYQFLQSKGEYGQGGKMRAFLDANPELEGSDIRLNRTAADDEKLYREYLTGQMWGAISGASDLQKKLWKSELGADFAANFLDKTTRNYDNVPTAQLLGWANALRVPMMDTAEKMPTPEPYKVTFPTEAQNTAYETFRADVEKAIGWETYYQLNAQYQTLKQQDAKNASAWLKTANGQKLVAVWEAQDQFYKDNPDIQTMLEKAGAIAIKREAAPPSAGTVDAQKQAWTASLSAIGYTNYDEYKAESEAYYALPKGSQARRDYLATHPRLARQWAASRAIYGEDGNTSNTGQTTKTSATQKAPYQWHYYAPRTTNRSSGRPGRIHKKYIVSYSDLRRAYGGGNTGQTYAPLNDYVLSYKRMSPRLQ